LIHRVRPDLILEIGTNNGGGALYMADILDNIGWGDVHTVDVVDMVTSTLVKDHPRIKRFLGGYQEYTLPEEFVGKTVIVIDDGSHIYEDVIACLEKFKDAVSVNSYFIVEDGVIDELGYPGYNGGPLRAIDEFLHNNENFFIDRGYCNFYGYNATFNPNGYLRKSHE
jgi:cephalosporin hydroxylase